MGYPAYLSHSNNAIVSATLTPSTESAVYPANNVKALPISKPWRTTSDTSQSLQIDLGASYDVDYFAIVNHNLSSAATVTLNGGGSANPDGGEFTRALAWSEFNMGRIFPAQSFRYWKLNASDPTNPDSYLEIGYLICGQLSRFAFGFNQGWLMSDEYVNVSNESEMGARLTTGLYYQREIRLRFENVPDMQTLLDLYRKCQMDVVPAALLLDIGSGSDLDCSNYFGRFNGPLVRTIDVKAQHAEMVWREDSRGRSI